jgi:lysophospholipase L1-like esterase
VVLCVGDSITFGKDSSNPPFTGYPNRLAQELGPAFGGMFDVINAGISGETTDRGLARLPGLIAQHRPEWMILMEGTNDHFFGRSYSSIQNNLLSMVWIARANGVSPMVGNTPPVISRPGKDRSLQSARIQGLNPILLNTMNANQVPVADVYGALTSVPSWPFVVMATGNHPNDTGYEILKNTFMDTIRKALMDGRLY